MIHRSWAEIDLKKLNSNLTKIHNYSQKDIFAVIKADAYGHNAVLIGKYLQKIKEVKYLCVATAEEGLELRKANIQKEILILGGILKEEIEIFDNFNLVPVISDNFQLELVKNLKNKKVHLKFDTGMHRLGFYEKDLPFIFDFLKKNQIQVEGLMSHLSSADIDPDYTNFQIKQFKELLNKFKKENINPKFIHIQNSAGIKYSCNFCNAIRVGISIYGEKPCEDFPLEIETIMSLKSKIISIKELKKDEKVSYCGTFTANKDMKIGVVSFGYADGLPRCLSNKGFMIVKDKKVPIIGNITMDMTIIDITQNKNINIGDEVIIVGKSKNNKISFSDIAKICNTIPYEIMCGISKRVYRKAV